MRPAPLSQVGVQHERPPAATPRGQGYARHRVCQRATHDHTPCKSQDPSAGTPRHPCADLRGRQDHMTHDRRLARKNSRPEGTQDGIITAQRRKCGHCRSRHSRRVKHRPRVALRDISEQHSQHTMPSQREAVDVNPKARSRDMEHPHNVRGQTTTGAHQTIGP